MTRALHRTSRPHPSGQGDRATSPTSRDYRVLSRSEHTSGSPLGRRRPPPCIDHERNASRRANTVRCRKASYSETFPGSRRTLLAPHHSRAAGDSRKRSHRAVSDRCFRAAAEVPPLQPARALRPGSLTMLRKAVRGRTCGGRRRPIAVQQAADGVAPRQEIPSSRQTRHRRLWPRSTAGSEPGSVIAVFVFEGMSPRRGLPPRLRT